MLINYVEEHIWSLYLSHTMGKVIWDKVKLAYSDIELSLQLCELKDHVMDLKQGGLNKDLVDACGRMLGN